MNELTSMYGRLKYLAESVDGIATDSNRGRLLATLLYWKVFEGVDIPDDLMRQIMEKGSSPDSIGRVTRMVLEDIKSGEDPLKHRREKRKQWPRKSNKN